MPALAFALLGLLVCPPILGQDPGSSQAWVSFEATWSASGQQQTLGTGGRDAAIVHLSGAFFITRGYGLGRGFTSEAIGYFDGGNVSVGRSALTDDIGDQIFADLKGEAIETGGRVVGTITGGSGRYAGFEGDFSFSWQYVVQGENGTFQGRSVGLKGRYRRRPIPATAPGPGGGSQ